MASAMSASGARTKRETIEMGLRMLLRLRRQGEIRQLCGALDWDGDVEAMRSDE